MSDIPITTDEVLVSQDIRAGRDTVPFGGCTDRTSFLSNETITDVLKEVLIKSKPHITYPSMQCSISPPSLEYASRNLVNPTLTLSFNSGSYEYNPGEDTGCLFSSVTISRLSYIDGVLFDSTIITQPSVDVTNNQNITINDYMVYNDPSDAQLNAMDKVVYEITGYYGGSTIVPKMNPNVDPSGFSQESIIEGGNVVLLKTVDIRRCAFKIASPNHTVDTSASVIRLSYTPIILDSSFSDIIDIDIQDGDRKVAFCIPADPLLCKQTVKIIYRSDMILGDIGTTAPHFDDYTDLFSTSTVSLGGHLNIDPIDYTMYTWIPAFPFEGTAHIRVYLV